MYVVIFQAQVHVFDAEYAAMAAQLREMALSEFGCTQFTAVTEGQTEIALSYWPDLDSIRRWKAQAQHLVAQGLGQQRWYSDYTVQIAKIQRAYSRSRSRPGAAEL